MPRGILALSTRNGGIPSAAQPRASLLSVGHSTASEWLALRQCNPVLPTHSWCFPPFALRLGRTFGGPLGWRDRRGQSFPFSNRTSCPVACGEGIGAHIPRRPSLCRSGGFPPGNLAFVGVVRRRSRPPCPSRTPGRPGRPPSRGGDSLPRSSCSTRGARRSPFLSDASRLRGSGPSRGHR